MRGMLGRRFPRVLRSLEIWLARKVVLVCLVAILKLLVPPPLVSLHEYLRLMK